jgi:replication-associated recombination protein RarA
VPGHLRAAAKTYQSPHGVGEPFDVSQAYLPNEIATMRFYAPSGSGAEAELRDRVAALRAARAKGAKP